jgi:hypothetical protein
MAIAINPRQDSEWATINPLVSKIEGIKGIPHREVLQCQNLVQEDMLH